MKPIFAEKLPLLLFFFYEHLCEINFEYTRLYCMYARIGHSYLDELITRWRF